MASNVPCRVPTAQNDLDFWTMIKAVHTLIYSDDPEATRAFCLSVTVTRLRCRASRVLALVISALILAACGTSSASSGPTAAIPSTEASITAAPSPDTTAGATPATGDVALEALEFDVPAGSHPHDVAPAADGGVWYTGQHNGVLGHLDPATGTVREIPLGAGSAPHGVIVASDGAAWITDGGLNAIVRVDRSDRRGSRVPAAVRPSRVPTSTPPPSTATGSSGLPDSPGSTDGWTRPPATCRLRRSGGPRPVWHRRDAGRRCLVRLARGEPPRSRRSVARRAPRSSSRRRPGRVRGASGPIRTGGSGSAEWNAGQVGVHDPASGSWEEWRLPGDGPQAYAVYVDERDIVWLTDFGAERDRPLRSGDRVRSIRSHSRARAPPSASCLAGPARCGAPNPRPTSWSVSPKADRVPARTGGSRSAATRPGSPTAGMRPPLHAR